MYGNKSTLQIDSETTLLVPEYLATPSRLVNAVSET